MSQGRVSEAVARPARTAIQMAPAGVVTELIDVFVYNMDERGYAAVFAGLTLLFGWAQTVREDYKGKAWWLRSVPPKQVPLQGE